MPQEENLPMLHALTNHAIWFVSIDRKCIKSAVFGDPDNLWEIILYVRRARTRGRGSTSC